MDNGAIVVKVFRCRPETGEAGRLEEFRVASAAPLGVRNILKSGRLAETQGEQAAKKVIFQDVAEVMKSEDMKEGLLSFIERRKAVFKGK